MYVLKNLYTAHRSAVVMRKSRWSMCKRAACQVPVSGVVQSGTNTTPHKPDNSDDINNQDTTQPENIKYSYTFSYNHKSYSRSLSQWQSSESQYSNTWIECKC